MTDYRKILMLRSMGCSQREMERNKIASRETSKAVFETADRLGISWPLDDDITNADLERMLFPDKYKNVCLYDEPDYQYIHRELAKPGVTLTLLWEEYCNKCYEAKKKPYMSTQFGDKYRKWARVTKATMRIQHKPGDSIQVDWAGDTIPIYDSVTGKQSSAYLFVAVLPCSYYAYMEACADMKTRVAECPACRIHSRNCERTRLMSGDIRQGKNVYIVTEYTDWRKGFQSSVPYVMQNFKVDHTKVAMLVWFLQLSDWILYRQRFASAI